MEYEDVRRGGRRAEERERDGKRDRDQRAPYRYLHGLDRGVLQEREVPEIGREHAAEEVRHERRAARERHGIEPDLTRREPQRPRGEQAKEERARQALRAALRLFGENRRDRAHAAFSSR